MTVPTARGLKLFREELEQAGFEPDLVRDLVVTACQADITTSGLNVAPPVDSEPTEGALSGYGLPNPHTERS